MNNYIVDLMFNGNFRHHDINTGKPTTKLLDINGKHLKDTDANLFYPTKEGLIIVEYLNGNMTAYAYLVPKGSEIIEVKKLPYGTLKDVKNELQVPDNVLRTNIGLIAQGDTTWFFWKSLMNSENLQREEEHIFPTLTTNQERIPNSGMYIDYNKEENND